MQQLVLENITKIYTHNKEINVRAIDKVSFSVEKGEMIAVVGESGSGKSTLLHILGLLDESDSGDYFIDGVKSNEMKEKVRANNRGRSIGFVLQQFGLINKRTAIENIIIPLLFLGYSIKESKKIGMKKMKLLGIEDLANRHIENLSGGQKQRVAIARAIICEPKVILADEPTGALDSKTSEEIMKILLSLNNLGITIIVATHDPIVADLCNRKITLSDGIIVGDRKIHEVN